MKIVMTIFLCCVTYVTAAPPSCSKQEFWKCKNNRYSIITEQELDSFCQDEVQCSLDFWDRCGTNLDVEAEATYKWYTKMHDSICRKNSPIREKYIENGKCLYEKITEELPSRCPMKGEDSEDRTELCRQVREKRDCSYRFMEQECGKDAREVFTYVYADTGYYYGC